MAKDCSEKIEKITPSPSELVMTSWQEKQPVKCSEPGCSHIAANMSVLNLHKAKVHKLTTSLDKNVTKQFHCPVSSCYFNSTSERYFKNIDILRVHFMKVHYEKNFKCSKCDKKFGLARDCQRHEEECGQLFACPDCGKVYTKKDSLLRHCDVQKHKKPSFPPKPQPVKKNRAEKSKKAEAKSERRRGIPVFILPKQPSQVILPMESQRVDLPGDLTKAHFIVSKPSQYVGQAVQTLCQPSTSDVTSTSLQTASCRQEPVHTSCQCPGEKISLGIQTIVLVPSVQQNNAEVQTKDIVDKSLFKPSALPKAKINKSTQKSKSSKQNVIKANSTSQTNLFTIPKKHLEFESTHPLRLTESKKPLSLMPPSVYSPGLVSSIEDILTNMSTQTDFSCLLEEGLPDSQNNNLPRLPTHYNSHTQITPNDVCQLNIDESQNPFLLFENKNIQTSNLEYQEQTTQTQKYSSKSIYSQTSQLDTSYILSQERKILPEHKNAFDICQNNTYIDEHLFSVALQAQDNRHIHLNGLSENLTHPQHCDAQTFTCRNSQPAFLQTMPRENNVHVTNFSKSSPRSNTRRNQQEIFELATGEDKVEPEFNDFAWDMGTQTFENLMWEMGTQTFEDFVAEIGTQTISDSTPLQTTDTTSLEMGTQTMADIASLQNDPLRTNCSFTLGRFSSQDFTKGTQTNHNSGSFEAAGMSRETIASQTMDILCYESQIGNMAAHGRVQRKAVADLNCQTDFQSLTNLDLETQTIIDTPLPESIVNMSIDIDAQTEAKVTALHTTLDPSMEIGTQTKTDNTSLSTLNNLSLGIGTQTTTDTHNFSAMDDFNLDMGTQTITDISSLSKVDNSGLDIATQTIADFTNLPRLDNFAFDMETQTMNDIYDLTKLGCLNLEIGTQTMDEVVPILEGLEMETQTMADISYLSTTNNPCPEMGTQTMANISLLPAGQETSLKTNTMAYVTSSLATDDLGSDMETQTVTDTTALDTFDAIEKMIGRHAGANAVQRCVGDLGLEMGTSAIADYLGLQSQDSQSYEMGTQTMANMTALPADDTFNFGMGTQTLEQFITNSCTQTENTPLWYDNVVTQTEEDLLEFLTRETQTQTGDDLLEFLTRETETQTHMDISGDERAAQTDRYLMDFFTTETQTQATEASSNHASVNHVDVGTGDDLLEFLTKESETQTIASLAF